MPFTISHVAAVLPFSRWLVRWRVLSATVIGTMVPDFGFLMPWRPSRVETHSASALLTFCLPVGLVTFWIFEAMIKGAVSELLSDGAHARWRASGTRYDPRNLRQWAVAACGILAGAFTHLVWDAFTHEEARGVRMFPALDEPIFDFAGHHVLGARLLQDVSSLIGLGAVLAAVVYGLRREPSALKMPARRLRPAERHAWTVAYVAAALLLAGLFLVIRRPLEGAGHSVSLVVENFAIAALRGVAAAVVLVSLTLRMRLRASPVGSARSELL